MAGIDHCPLPHAVSFNCLNWLGGGTEQEVRGGALLGGSGQGGKGKGKRQLSLETWWHLGGQGENEESSCSAEWPRIAKG